MSGSVACFKSHRKVNINQISSESVIINDSDDYFHITTLLEHAHPRSYFLVHHHEFRSCTTGGEQMTGWLDMPEISKRASIMVQFCEANFPRKLSAPAAFLQLFTTRGTEANQAWFASVANFVNRGKWSVHHHDGPMIEATVLWCWH